MKNKKILKWIIVIFIIIITLPSKGQITKSLSYSFDDIQFTTQSKKGRNFEKIKMGKAFQSRSIGKPELPVYYYKFYIKKGEEVTGITFECASVKETQVRSDIFPVQHPILQSKIGIDTTFDAPDPIIYLNNSYYPVNNAAIINSDFIDGDLEILNVAIYPIQYNPVLRKIKLADNGVLRIITSKTTTSKPTSFLSYNRFKDHANTPLMVNLVKSMVENPEDVPIINNIPLATDNLSNLKSAQIAWSVPFYEYVVITTRALKPAFNQFISWKKRKGYNAGVVCIEEILKDPAATGDPVSPTLTDDAGKLRQYLMAGYNNTNPKTTFALLGGDYSPPIPIPIRYGFGGDELADQGLTWENNGAHVPTDLYFSDFNTDWTYVSSVKTGTRYSGFSYGPEIYVGRLMCNSENDINIWTKKVIQYEKNPGNGDYSYLSKALVTEADEITTIDMYELELFFSTVKLWQELSSDIVGTSTEPHFPKGADVINELNTNYGFYNVFNHGSPNSIATATYGINGWENKAANIPHRYQVTTSDSYLLDANITRENGNGLDNLTNFNYPTILYSNACITMPFDNIQASGTRNLGVSYTVANLGGGPSYLGNTRDGFIQDSKMLEVCFLRHIASNPQIGVAECAARAGWNGFITVQDDYSHHVVLAHNLLGCPETSMWTTTPSLFNGSVSENTDKSVTVNTGGIVADKICVTSALNDGYFEVRPNLSSFTFPNVSKPYYVTITKANYIPYTNVLTNVYVQNKNLSKEAYLSCQSVTAGYNVDPDPLQTDGDVVIQNGASITFDATGDITLASGFDVQLGATFEAK